MCRNVIALVLAVAAVAAAAGLPATLAPAMQDPLVAGEQRLDPRIEALHQRMAAADRAGNTAEAKRLGCEVQRILLDRQHPARPVGEFSRQVSKAPVRRPAAGSDVVIHSGYVLAHATDYEMDGTMWTAVSDRNDSMVSIYKSTDHGQSWIHYSGFYTIPKSPISKLELVVGPPESSFIYTFYIHPNENGNLRDVRMGRDTTGYWDFAIQAGPDTVTDFAACRDYSIPDYWLYAVSYNEMSTVSLIHRSTDYAQTWAEVDTFSNMARPMMQAGARRYIYLSSVPNQNNYVGWVGFVYSKNWGEPGSWYANSLYTDSQEVYDASVSPAFTLPDSEAVVWLVFSQVDTSRSQWDALFSYRNGIADAWHARGVLSGDTAVDEAYLDLRPYTETGNAWMNASYCHMPGSPNNNVYRKYVNASTPGNWSESLQINSGDIDYSVNFRPRLCYSPGAPGTGAGCAFAGDDQVDLKWNSPWYTGVDERAARRVSGLASATVVRGGLFLPPASFVPRRSALLDVSGRTVMPLAPGRNDVRQLARGVYYVMCGQPQPATKVVLE